MRLPTRICAVCARPFAWRRKWARDWPAVRYCRDACRSRRGRVAATVPDASVTTGGALGGSSGRARATALAEMRRSRSRRRVGSRGSR
ncbi:DUF2256 domain-containing protein [Candidatus Binatia bacterium]|nr:DUF2256 domain-containing protein [Candidatus Binatia bacterium]